MGLVGKPVKNASINFTFNRLPPVRSHFCGFSKPLYTYADAHTPFLRFAQKLRRPRIIAIIELPHRPAWWMLKSGPDDFYEKWYNRYHNNITHPLWQVLNCIQTLFEAYQSGNRRFAGCECDLYLNHSMRGSLWVWNFCPLHLRGSFVFSILFCINIQWYISLLFLFIKTKNTRNIKTVDVILIRMIIQMCSSLRSYQFFRENKQRSMKICTS